MRRIDNPAQFFFVVNGVNPTFFNLSECCLFVSVFVYISNALCLAALCVYEVYVVGFAKAVAFYKKIAV